jgi:hypothetical protein
MQRRVPSIEKAQRLIGYQPTRTLEEIINNVAEQFREELKADLQTLNCYGKYIKIIFSRRSFCICFL